MRSYITTIIKKTLLRCVLRIWEVKKLVLVLATSTLMTSLNKKTLEYIPCIYYLVQFKKHTMRVKALIHLESEVNAISPIYTKKLDLRIHKTNIRA